MKEFWDIYNQNREKTARIAQRDVYIFKENEYHIVVTGIIINSDNKILISKRAANKTYGLLWECNGGSILAGETSLEGIIRELQEEIGIQFTKKEAIYLKEIKREKVPADFKDLWLFRRNINVEELQFCDKEVVEAKWVTIDEFLEMKDKKQIVPTIDFGIDEYKKALQAKQRESYAYIGNMVQVKIDRPINSKHPTYQYVYPINYGYIPNTKSSDGEELDCYILGIEKPIENFEGKCIAVIHRNNDDDDKLVVVPKEKNYTDEEIKHLTYFQEQYFESEIIR